MPEKKKRTTFFFFKKHLKKEKTDRNNIEKIEFQFNSIENQFKIEI
jgi:hypothetical protein